MIIERVLIDYFFKLYNSNGNSYNELLNPEPAINEISEESLDIDGNIIKIAILLKKRTAGISLKFSWKKVFLRENVLLKMAFT